MESRLSFKMDEGEVKEGGSDSGVETNGAAAVSCDSSLVSCCSEEALRALEEDEGGSEGSSVSGGGGKPPRTPRTSHRPARPPAKERSVSRGPHLARSVSLRQEPQTKKPTPRSPLDDGRWPSTAAPRVKPRPPEKKSVNIMSVSVGPLSHDHGAKEKYATLPTRRRRNSLENLDTPRPAAAASVSRDLSLNRAASLRRKKESPGGTGAKPRGRTRIYHEVCVQTAFTGQDLEAALAGNATKTDPFTRVETVDSSVQVDKRIEAVERLELELKQLHEKMTKVSEEKKCLEKCRDELKTEKALRHSLERRLRALLPDKFSDGELVDCVEKHCNLKNEICLKQQQEITKLQNMVVNLRRDLERSFMMHRKYLEQQQEVEAESIEIQEFLQAEKSTLADTLKDLETEVETAKKELAEKEAELEKQQEECSHLVRISEQRRQEKLAIEARLKAVETNSRTVMLEQSNSISSASVALTSLGSKLEGLIDALVTSYNISQQDLEEVVFHNEAYSGSGSGSGSPEADTSPRHKPSNQGFLASIFKALWAPSQKSLPVETVSECEMLSAEPEPPAFSIQEGTTASSKRLSIASIASISDMSHRASLTTSDDLDIPGENSGDGSLVDSGSLQNLSHAILQRQREEEEINREILLQPPPPNNLVDLVIHVDNLVTKLLNIMHIVHNRKVDSEKGRLSIEAASTVLKEEIVELTEKLNICSKSSEQVEVLQKALKEKERELNDLEMKFELTQELLTNNWHKAMSEVKRQYEAIDAALEALNGIGDEIRQNPSLCKVQRELEEANFRCATSLPVSSSQPDLNANAAPRTINGRV